MTGYYRGMYKSNTYNVNQNCLGTQMLNSVVDLRSAVLSGDPSKTVNAGLQGYQLYYYFLKFCDFDDTIDDMLQWCFTQDCSPQYIGETLLKKVFNVTAIFNNLAQFAMQDQPKENDYMALQNYVQ